MSEPACEASGSLGEMARAAAASSGGTFGALALAAVGTKFAASALGTQGIGLLGAMRQIQQAGAAMGTLGGQSALVQGLSAREGTSRAQFLGAALRACLACSAATALAVVLAAPWIARAMSGSAEPRVVLLVRLMALPVALAVAQAILGAVLAANGARVRLGIAQVAGGLAFAALAWPCARLAAGGDAWALAALLASFSGVTALSSWWWARGEGWLDARAPEDGGALRAYVRTAGTLLASQLVSALVLLAVRALVVHRGGGLGAAGLFDAAWSLGMTYMTVALVALNTYYLPELSRARDAEERGRLIARLVRFMLAVAVPAILAMIALRPLVLRLFYTRDFLPALDVFRWMLAGDVFKMLAWVLGIPMLALGELRALLMRELLWNAMFLGLSAAALASRGSIEGVGAAFLASYVVLAALNAARARSHGLRAGRGLVGYGAAGIALIAVASWAEWSSRQTRPAHAAAWLLAGLAYAVAGARSLRAPGAGAPR